MKKVLIFDTDKPTLAKFSVEKKFYGCFEALHTASYKLAVRQIENYQVDLLVADIKKKHPHGFHLLSYVREHHPEIPVLIICENYQEVQDRIHASGYSDYYTRPLDMDMFMSRLISYLEVKDLGIIQGMSLSAFLQMIDLEVKTCSLTVKSGHRLGRIYCRNGELIIAKTGGLRGSEAFYEMICWENILLRVENECKKEGRNIHKSLMQMLMEGSRIRDERGIDSPAESMKPDHATCIGEGLDEEQGEEDISNYLVSKDGVTLIDILNQTPEILEYGIFDCNDGLLVKSPQSERIDKLLPSRFFSPAEKAAVYLQSEKLKYLVINEKGHARYSFFKHEGSIIALLLAPDMHPADLMNRFMENGFQPGAC